MTTLKEYYKGDMPCNDCIHKNVCNVKSCFEETRFETTHPFVDIQVRCTEYHYYGGQKRNDRKHEENQRVLNGKNEVTE